MPVIRRLANITIRGKVIAAFAAALCCAVELGLFSVARLDKVNDAAAIVATYVERTRLLGQFSYVTMRFRQLEATAALVTDPAARTQEDAIMAKVRAQVEQICQEYEHLGATNDGQQKANETIRLWQTYLVLHEGYMALAQSGDAAAMTELYRGAMRMEFNTFQDSLNALAGFNDHEAKDHAAEAAEFGSSARIWILGILALAALACVGIGISLIRGVSQPITVMTEAMRRLAAKDQGVVVPGIGRADEVGQMAQACGVRGNGRRRRPAAAAETQAQARGMRRQAAMDRYTQDFGASAAGVMANLARSPRPCAGRRRP